MLVGCVQKKPFEHHRDIASYPLFNGREVDFIKLESGETLHLSYDRIVEAGSLTLPWESPDEDLIWEETFTEGKQGTFDFTSEMEGRCRIIVIGDETRGELDLAWEIIELEEKYLYKIG